MESLVREETMKKKRHAAIIEIDKDFLLRLMEFQGGKIYRIYTRDDYFDPPNFFVVIEHPDLPEVEEGQPLAQVKITMATTFGENGVPIKIERMDPPKKQKIRNLLPRLDNKKSNTVKLK